MEYVGSLVQVPHSRSLAVVERQNRREEVGCAQQVETIQSLLKQQDQDGLVCSFQVLVRDSNHGGVCVGLAPPGEFLPVSIDGDKRERRKGCFSYSSVGNIMANLSTPSAQGAMCIHAEDYGSFDTVGCVVDMRQRQEACEPGCCRVIFTKNGQVVGEVPASNEAVLGLRPSLTLLGAGTTATLYTHSHIPLIPPGCTAPRWGPGVLGRIAEAASEEVSSFTIMSDTDEGGDNTRYSGVEEGRWLWEDVEVSGGEEGSSWLAGLEARDDGMRGQPRHVISKAGEGWLGGGGSILDATWGSITLDTTTATGADGEAEEVVRRLEKLERWVEELSSLLGTARGEICVLEGQLLEEREASSRALHEAIEAMEAKARAEELLSVELEVRERAEEDLESAVAVLRRAESELMVLKGMDQARRRAEGEVEALRLVESDWRRAQAQLAEVEEGERRAIKELAGAHQARQKAEERAEAWRVEAEEGKLCNDQLMQRLGEEQAARRILKERLGELTSAVRRNAGGDGGPALKTGLQEALVRFAEALGDGSSSQTAEALGGRGLRDGNIAADQAAQLQDSVPSPAARQGASWRETPACCVGISSPAQATAHATAQGSAWAHALARAREAPCHHSQLSPPPSNGVSPRALHQANIAARAAATPPFIAVVPLPPTAPTTKHPRVALPGGRATATLHSQLAVPRSVSAPLPAAAEPDASGVAVYATLSTISPKVLFAGTGGIPGGGDTMYVKQVLTGGGGQDPRVYESFASTPWLRA